MINTSLMPLVAMAWWGKLLIGILIVLLILLVVLIIVGGRLQKKQTAQKEQLDAMAQTVSMLIIDKKTMRMCDAGLPKEVMDQTPKLMRRSKLPFVKVKIDLPAGSRIMTMIADAKIFDQIPVKKTIRAVVSGIYITEIKSVRGGSIPAAPVKKKKGLFGRLKKDK